MHGATEVLPVTLRGFLEPLASRLLHQPPPRLGETAMAVLHGRESLLLRPVRRLRPRCHRGGAIAMLALRPTGLGPLHPCLVRPICAETAIRASLLPRLMSLLLHLHRQHLLPLLHRLHRRLQHPNDRRPPSYLDRPPPNVRMAQASSARVFPQPLPAGILLCLRSYLHLHLQLRHH